MTANQARRTILHRMALTALAVAAGPDARAWAGQDDGGAIAHDVVQDLTQARFARLRARMSPKLAEALPEDTLSSVWRDVTGRFGAVRSAGEAYQENGAVRLPVRFERGSLDLKIIIRSGKLETLQLVPPKAGKPPPWTPPDYAAPGSYHEVETRVGDGPFTLGATLTLPVNGSGPFPAVVLVHGSGPSDRDETLGPNRPFKDLALGLASRGIAVLRYDKRTLVYPQLFAPPAAFTVREETIEDALAAVALLKRTPQIDKARIFIAGHSQGGTLGPRILAGDPAISGLIILAGATRKLPDILVEQSNYLSRLSGEDPLVSAPRLLLLRKEADRALAARPETVGLPSLGAPLSYWADLNAYDAAAAAGATSRPMLIMQGGRDYQVTGVDFDAYKTALAGRADVTFRTFPLLNHLLMRGGEPPSPSDYDTPAHVEEPVIAEIVSFISAGR